MIGQSTPVVRSLAVNRLFKLYNDILEMYPNVRGNFTHQQYNSDHILVGASAYFFLDGNRFYLSLDKDGRVLYRYNLLSNKEFYKDMEGFSVDNLGKRLRKELSRRYVKLYGSIR